MGSETFVDSRECIGWKPGESSAIAGVGDRASLLDEGHVASDLNGHIPMITPESLFLLVSATDIRAYPDAPMVSSGVRYGAGAIKPPAGAAGFPFTQTICTSALCLDLLPSLCFLSFQPSDPTLPTPSF